MIKNRGEFWNFNSAFLNTVVNLSGYDKKYVKQLLSLTSLDLEEIYEGKKEIMLDELQLICEYFKISPDSLFKHIKMQTKEKTNK